MILKKLVRQNSKSRVRTTLPLITEDLEDWWLGGGFYGGFIGGGFTAFFMYLLWRES